MNNESKEDKEDRKTELNMLTVDKQTQTTSSSSGKPEEEVVNKEETDDFDPGLITLFKALLFYAIIEAAQ